MSTVPYKDDNPTDTIQRVRGVLLNNGIFTTEYFWRRFHKSFYSCRVVIKDTMLGTNGKGRTPEYSLASAYGEFMERLQNLLLFPRVEFDAKTVEKFGFLLDKNEKIVAKRKAPALPESFREAKPFQDDESLYELWNTFLQSDSSKNRVLQVPFYNVLKKEVTYLPIFYLIHVYRSNGMCAGNTHEESITQGMLEIFERYAMKRIYKEELAPPTIPDDYIKKHAPEQWERIQEIESSEKFRIIVKDCTLGKGVPVLATLIIDLESNAYIIKYGAELTFQWALERCLTEFFQGGYKGGMVNKFSDLRLDPYDQSGDLDNFSSILAIGKGRHSNGFFNREDSYAFNGYIEQDFPSMKEKIRYMNGIVKQLGYQDLFIRDASYMGFPAHYIIIPGMSEGFILSDFQRKRMLESFSPTKALTDLASADDDELRAFIDDLEHYSAMTQKENIFLTDYFPIPHDDNKDWSKVTLEFLLAMMYFKLGDYQKARDNLSTFISFIKKNFRDIDLRYHLCVREYLSLKIREYDDGESLSILRNLFDRDVVDMVREDFENPANIFQHLKLPTCWDCGNCPVSETCTYEKLKDIYLTLKRNQNENQASPDSLGVIFADL